MPAAPIYPSPLDFSLPHDAPQSSYDHIGTLAPILAASSSTLIPDSAEQAEDLEELADTTLTTAPRTSTPPADPLEFLKALKRTKLAPAAAVAPSPVATAPAAKVDEDNPLLEQWEGLGKGAATRSAWEGAGEVEGLEGGHWRNAVGGGGGSDEDEST